MADEPYKKRDTNVLRLIPGEGVRQFGGMTPEAFDGIAQQIEEILLATFGSTDGAMSMYVHLAVRLFLIADDVVGQEHADQVMEVFINAMRDALVVHRQRLSQAKERAVN